MTERTKDPPAVDPSPAQPPIAVNAQPLDELLAAHPAPASDPRTLALEPNRYEDATSGPDEQISQTAYVEIRKPDGTTFLSPLSNVPYYEGKGYTAGAERDIPDFVAYLAEQAGGPHMEEPQQSPEDVLKRLSGVPKTEEELEGEREAQEEARRKKMEAAHPAPTTDADRASRPAPRPAPEKPPASS